MFDVLDMLDGLDVRQVSVSLLFVPPLLARPARVSRRCSSALSPLFRSPKSHQSFSFYSSVTALLLSYSPTLVDPLHRRPHPLGHLWHTPRNVYRSFHPPFVSGRGQALPSIASAPYNRLSNLSDARLLPNCSTHPKIIYSTELQALGMK